MELVIVIGIIVLIVVFIVSSRVQKGVKEKARRILAEGKITDRSEFEYVCSQLQTDAGDLTSTGKLEAKDLWERLQALDREPIDWDGVGHKKLAEPPESPLQILDRRYAQGEIDKAEYEEKRKALTSTEQREQP